MLAFSYVLDFLAHEFAGLSRWSLVFLLVLPGAP
jgi:hypothetical protein